MKLFGRIIPAVFIFCGGLLLAQDAGSPLTTQGMDQFFLTGVRARGMGGTVLAIGGDANSVFSNPSLLTSVKNMNVRIGGSSVFSTYKQRQEWHPDEYYAELSLVIEGTIRNVIDTLAQKLARPFDTITPDNEMNTTRTFPAQFSVSLPFELFETKLNVSAGVTEEISLNTYFQNNNVLDPNIGAYRPSPVIRPKVGDSTKVQWYQFVRERSGSVNGYVIGGAVDVVENLTIGVSGTLYDGSSDDVQRRVDRGTFVLKTNNSSGFNVMRNDSIYKHVTTTGTSDYSGMNGTIAGAYHNEVFTVSAVVNTPLELTREWKQTTQQDSMGSSFSSAKNGKEKISIPLQYSFGISLRPSSKVTVGIDYMIRSFDEMKYSGSDTTVSHWLNSSFLRAGIEYSPSKWIAIRAGFRENVQTFAAAGAGILNDPVRGSVYTFGLGTKFESVSIDAAYEYSLTKYVDAWESNLNYNTIQSHNIMVELGYQF